MPPDQPSPGRKVSVGVNGIVCLKVPSYSSDAQHLQDLSVFDALIDSVQAQPLIQGSDTSANQVLETLESGKVEQKM